MEHAELSNRIDVLERTIRNMRIAVIIIAAFFLYESIAPSGFGQMDVRVMQTLKLKELIVLDKNNQMRMRLAADDEGPAVLLDNKDKGTRMVLTDQELSLWTASERGYDRAWRFSGEGWQTDKVR